MTRRKNGSGDLGGTAGDGSGAGSDSGSNPGNSNGSAGDGGNTSDGDSGNSGSGSNASDGNGASREDLDGNSGQSDIFSGAGGGESPERIEGANAAGDGSDSGTEPVKRGRGRPRGSGRGAGDGGTGASGRASVVEEDTTGRTRGEPDGVTGAADKPPRKTRTRGSDAKGQFGAATREMLETIYEVSFFAVGAAARDVDTWQLRPEESRDLASATEAFLKTLPAARTKRILANIEKYAPGFTLAFTAGVITIPRVMVTYKKYQQAQNGKARVIAAQPAAGARAGGSGIPTTAGPETNIGNADRWGNVTGAARPLTAEDITGNGQ